MRYPACDDPLPQLSSYSGSLRRLSYLSANTVYIVTIFLFEVLQLSLA